LLARETSDPNEIDEALSLETQQAAREVNLKKTKRLNYFKFWFYIMLSSVLLVDIFGIFAVYNTTAESTAFTYAYRIASIVANWPPAVTTFFIFRELFKILSKDPEMELNKRQIVYNYIVCFLLIFAPLTEIISVAAKADALSNIIYISIDMAILIFCWRVTTHQHKDGEKTEKEESNVEEEEEFAQINMIDEQLDDDKESRIITNAD
jgi:hypothetical protein